MLSVAGTMGITMRSGSTFVEREAQNHSATIRHVSILRERWVDYTLGG